MLTIIILLDKEFHGKRKAEKTLDLISLKVSLGLRLPRWCSGKESTYQCRRCNRHMFDPWIGKITWRSKWQPTLVFLPGKFHGQRNQAGNSPWGHKDLDTTEWLSTAQDWISMVFLPFAPCCLYPFTPTLQKPWSWTKVKQESLLGYGWWWRQKESSGCVQ